jgi:hypothetical protein
MQEKTLSVQVANSLRLVYQQHGMASQICKRKSKNDFKVIHGISLAESNDF